MIRPSWDVSPAEAILIQKELYSKRIIDGNPIPKLIAGMDVSFNRFQSTFLYASMVVFTYPDLQIVDQSTQLHDTRFPYIPGLLSFREGPALEKVYDTISIKPDLIMFDGQGYAHPRRLGIASFLGIRWNIPTIGCAKSLLIGNYEPFELKKGRFSPLVDRKIELDGTKSQEETETIGYALCTKDRTKPIFVSPGYRIGFNESMAIVLSCIGTSKTPIPIIAPHILANTFRRQDSSSK